MSQRNSGSVSNELENLSNLGVQVIDQAVLERTVHDQASRDMIERSIDTEQKRLAKLDAALVRRRQMLAKAHETMGKSSQPTARYASASNRAERLEEEIDQLTDDRNQVVERLAQAQAQLSSMPDTASSVDATPTIASMIVPQRRAAAKAMDAAKSDDEDSVGANSEQDSQEVTRNVSTGDDSDASYHEEGNDLSDGPDSDADMSGGVTSRRRSPNVQLTRSTRLRVHDFDDGNEHAYQERVHAWCVARWHERCELGDSADVTEGSDPDNMWVADDGARIPRTALAQEPFLPDPGTTDHLIKAHGRGKPPLAVPMQIWSRLLEYQKAALKWMYVLHEQNAGGILGDEMGLGKTVQVTGFLASMYHSKLLARPSIVVCPATLMRQWVREFHAWWPTLRVVILHGTGYAMQAGSSGMPGEDGLERLDLSSELTPQEEVSIWEDSRANSIHISESKSRPADHDAWSSAAGYSSGDEYEYDAYGSRIRRKRQIRGLPRFSKKQKVAKRNPISSRASREGRRRAEQLVERVHSKGHIIVVTYSGLQVYQDALLTRKWGYAVLDEGHMIRNPDAEVTLACKRLDTRHRILVTGTPIQNNLTELWSLFDFIFPGRLGTLPVFNNQFAVPITVGGYASANSLQVRAGYRCACILRDLIDPYLLRRMKADVAQDLPQKSEQVLFCRLTPMQRAAYTSFLRSNDMEKILSGKLQMLFGVDVARKICDHPDLLLLSTLPTAVSTHNEARLKERDSNDSDVDYEAAAAGILPADYGDYQKSGKLSILRALLDMWQPQGHKVLVFSQTRQMLDIIERMLRQMPACVFRRMDGSTPVQNRAALVDEFNTNPDIFVFLLTTKVGGLGVNLTGADRVILYSPDWNPSSDMQARERAWRLGQTRDVAIYRLMTAGTIEEKIYNRQIYKQFLSNKILSDPNQKRFFQAQSLRDLFSLSGFDTGEEVVAGANASAETRFGRCAESTADDQRQQADMGHEATETARMFANAQLLPKPDDADNASIPADIEEIGGVVRLEPYRPVQDEDDSSAEASDAAGPSNRRDHKPNTNADSPGKLFTGNGLEEEDRVLQSLFKMSGMHSALKHDAIINGKDADVNYERIEAEAERVASGARTALQESRKARRQLDISVPTWTGSSGEAGMPGGKQRFGTKVNPNLVAPPPSVIMSNELPDEFKFKGLQALGGSRPRNLPPATLVVGDSLVQNAVTMVRTAKIGRALPTGRAVSSLSLHHSTAERKLRQSASASGPPSRFGSHSTSGMYGGTAPSTSSNLLANLRARSDSIPAKKTGAELARVPTRQVTPLARRSAHEPAARSPGSRAAVRTNNGWPGIQSSASRMARKDTSTRSRVMTEQEQSVVEAVRMALEDAGGEMGSRELIERFERQMPEGGTARLKELAMGVADLVSRQPQGARHTGIGRVVHKVWVLREKCADEGR